MTIVNKLIRRLLIESGLILASIFIGTCHLWYYKDELDSELEQHLKSYLNEKNKYR